MKFDKETANHVVEELSKIKDILKKQKSLGLYFEVSPDAIVALNQSDHPDKGIVIEHLHLARDIACSQILNNLEERIIVLENMQVRKLRSC